jgi:hypothetical protein
MVMVVIGKGGRGLNNLATDPIGEIRALSLTTRITITQEMREASLSREILIGKIERKYVVRRPACLRLSAQLPITPTSNGDPFALGERA